MSGDLINLYVKRTSCAVKGFPSCHLTPRRSLNSISVGVIKRYDSARSPMIFWPLSSYLTSELNKNPAIDELAESVAIRGLSRAGFDEVLRWSVEAMSQTLCKRSSKSFNLTPFLDEIIPFWNVSAYVLKDPPNKQ